MSFARLFSLGKLLASPRPPVGSIYRAFSTTPVSSFPKLKTHSGARKRWKAIASGVFKRAKAGHSHLNVVKRPGRKNRLAQTAYAEPGPQTKRLQRLMPYA
ncbi:hypothetical protein PLICRDRAFT_268747 [Plicaturopsis crispa FD-325 SS-3]|nr:hypothetical protein PLICRDRAFT_268747 [Plicaturopsis crispa FD-325 SS-3]